MADEARRWLADLAGSSLTYRIREMVDPRSEKARESALANPKDDVPPEIATRLIHDYLGKFYVSWIGEVIPALGNVTPQQAIKTEPGRRAVIDLLKLYEHGEVRRVREQGGKPFDFGFLWEELGLNREI